MSYLTEREAINTYKLAGTIAQDIYLPLLKEMFDSKVVKMQNRLDEALKKVETFEQRVVVLEATISGMIRKELGG